MDAAEVVEFDIAMTDEGVNCPFLCVKSPPLRGLRKFRTFVGFFTHIKNCHPEKLHSFNVKYRGSPLPIMEETEDRRAAAVIIDDLADQLEALRVEQPAQPPAAIPAGDLEAQMENLHVAPMEEN
jgi:hypothetical protein